MSLIRPILDLNQSSTLPYASYSHTDEEIHGLYNPMAHLSIH
jgi:hypothetical protein